VNRDLSNEQDSDRRGRLLDHLWELEVRSLHPRELGAVAQAQPVSLQMLQSSLAEGELVIDYALEPSPFVRARDNPRSHRPLRIEEPE
jgi:hypothetical protein